MSSAPDEGPPVAIHDEQGRVVIEVSLLATLYFDAGHDARRRAAVSAVVDDWLALAGDRVRWANTGRGFEPFDDATPARLAERVTGPDFNEKASWELYCHGGETKESASATRLMAFGVDRIRGERTPALSFLTFSFPLDRFEGAPDEANALALARSLSRLGQDDAAYELLSRPESSPEAVPATAGSTADPA